MTAIGSHPGAIVIPLDDLRERRADRRRPRPRPDRLRVLAAGGHTLMRAALRRLLAEAPGIAVLGPRSFERPDVVLLDVGTGHHAARAAARVAGNPDTAGALIVVLVEPRWEGPLPAAAQGAVSKDASPAELVAALWTLAAAG
jgi:DNA-binding NarL/FixJ family response regulator